MNTYARLNAVPFYEKKSFTVVDDFTWEIGDLDVPLKHMKMSVINDF